MEQTILQIVLTAAIGLISYLGTSAVKRFERTQDDMKSFLNKMQETIVNTSKDLGILTKQVEVNTDDIRTINQTIKTICESNREMLETIKDVQSKIEQETAVQAEKIERLEKDVEELKSRVNVLETK